MAARHGKQTAVVVDTHDLSAFFTNAETVGTVETSDVTTFGATDKAYIVGLGDGTITTDGLFDGSANAVDAILSAALAAAVNPIITVCQDGGAFGGRRCRMAQVIETSYSVTSPVADVVTANAEFQATGGIRSGVLLNDFATAISASANGTGYDNGALTNNGGVANLHVTANANSGTLGVKVQHSADNSTWADLTGGAFSTVAIGTTSAQRIVVAAGTLVNRWVRVVWTVGGAGNITVLAAFARN